MPCYHFVFHAFGTWHPDHPAGWHQHGVPGALRPSEPIATNRRLRQAHPAVFFAPDTQRALLHMVHDACERRGWRAHAVATNVTHLHLVASWTESTNPVDIHTKLKNLLALRAARVNNTRGRPWFSHGGKPRRVRVRGIFASCFEST
jgi:hypothetical protein